jgi:phosphonate transport system substrate-binding protein
MVNAGEIDPEVNVIIHRSEPIPGSPIAVRGDLPQDLKDRIQQALINMDEQVIYNVQGWGGIEKYVEVTDSDYDIIRETRDLLDL